MAKARVILDEKLDISDRYRVELEVLEIEPSSRHREGVKVSFVLIDAVEQVPRLVVDNHEPLGFHVHSELPGNKHARTPLKVENYQEALDEFWRMVEEITDGKD